MKLLNLFLNALYPEGVACLLCNRNARLDRRGLCEKCRESIDPAAEIHIDGVISGAVAAMHITTPRHSSYTDSSMATGGTWAEAWREGSICWEIGI